MENNWDPYTELVAHANLLRNHDNDIKKLLVQHAHLINDYNRMLRQIDELLDIIEAQGSHIERLETAVHDILHNDPQ